MKKIYNILQQGADILKQQGVPNELLEARILLSFVLQKDPLYLLTHKNEEIDEDVMTIFFGLIHERSEGKPLQYITHNQEFMSLDFYVNEEVLIPRNDTEVLVEKAIELMKNTLEPQVLDVCTGSGCIAVSLAYYLKEASVVGVDISSLALQVANKNAIAHHVQDRIEWIESNLLHAVSIEKKFHVIISNPPYIPKAEILSLMKEVKDYEPHLALDGGIDGLDFYREIVKQAYPRLLSDGFLLFEVGHNQAQEVKALMINEGFKNLFFVKDLAGINRVVGAQK